MFKHAKLIFAAFVAALVVTLVLVGILLISLPWFVSVAEWSYSMSGKDFEKAAGDTFPYIYVSIVGIAVGILGIAATLATVFINVGRAFIERRQQDTQKILLDTRLSALYQEQLELRRQHFPSSKAADLILKNYLANPRSRQSGAIRYLLNYYEFLAIGIVRGNLDEDTLKDSLRGMFCTLVYDLRMILHHVREVNGQDHYYENLVNLYFKWVKRIKDNGEWEEGINLGPTTCSAEDK